MSTPPSSDSYQTAKTHLSFSPTAKATPPPQHSASACGSALNWDPKSATQPSQPSNLTSSTSFLPPSADGSTQLQWLLQVIMDQSTAIEALDRHADRMLAVAERVAALFGVAPEVKGAE